MSFIYLASPYSHPSAAVREWRYTCALRAAAILMEIQCVAVFSPIAHSHPIAAHLPERLLMDHDFWMAQDLPMLSAATEMRVLTIPGWEDSKGVLREIGHASERGIQITYIAPNFIL